jgi:hypothetical protein
MLKCNLIKFQLFETFNLNQGDQIFMWKKRPRATKKIAKNSAQNIFVTFIIHGIAKQFYLILESF